MPTSASKPEAFAGRGDARLSPFFRALGRDLGGSPGRKAAQCQQIIKVKYGRTKMKQLWRLTTVQMERVLQEVGADVCWRPMIEDAGGFMFEVPDVPESAALVQTGGTLAAGRGELTRTVENTVADSLGVVSLCRIWVPEAIFALVTVCDPLNTRLKPAQVNILSTAWCVWLYCKTGKFNAGTALANHCGKQFDARYPLLPLKKEKGFAPILLRKSYLGLDVDFLMRPWRFLSFISLIFLWVERDISQKFFQNSN